MSQFSSRDDPGVQVTGDDDVLSLHRNENLFVDREWTVETAQRLVEQAAISTYPEATSLPLREALAELYGVETENVFVGNGSDEVLSDLLSLLRRSHDAVSCLDIHFKVYPMLAERLGYRLDALPGDTFTTGRIDASDFRGLALVDSPNGITGRRALPEDLFALADNDDSFLIWDNVYGEYAHDEKRRRLRENVAFVRSFSKFYGAGRAARRLLHRGRGAGGRAYWRARTPSTSTASHRSWRSRRCVGTTSSPPCATTSCAVASRSKKAWPSSASSCRRPSSWPCSRHIPITARSTSRRSS